MLETLLKGVIKIKGSVSKKGEKWYCIIELPRTDGRRKQKWVGKWDTKKEAEKALPKLLLEVQNGYHASFDKLTVQQYFDKYLSFKEDTYKATTYYTTSSLLRKAAEKIGHIELSKLSPLHIQDYLKSEYNKGLNRNFVKLQFDKLKQAFNQAKKWRLISYNPCDDVVPPKTQKSNFYVYTDEEIKTLLEATKGTNLYTPILLASICGLRRGECVALTWNDIDFKNKTITINKTSTWIKGEIVTTSTKTDNSERSIKMPNIIYNHLKSIRGIGNVCKNSTPFYHPQILYKDFQDACKKHGIKESKFHSLRHYAATTLLSKGVPIKLVSEILGHSNPSFTLRIYAHVMPSDHDKFVNVFDSMFC